MNNQIAGYEFSGTVAKAGPGFPYAVGDEVFGLKRLDLGSQFGAHQDWLLVEGNSPLAKRPFTLPKDAAAAISFAVRAVADAFFNISSVYWHGITTSGMTHSCIVIWVGDSAIGCAAVQIAKAADLDPIFAITNSSNFDTMRDLGATIWCDDRDNDVATIIKNCTDDIMYIFDCVGTEFSTAKCDELSRMVYRKFISILPVNSNDCNWHQCMPIRGWDMNLPPPTGHVRANEEAESNLVKLVAWAANNYGGAFRIPNLKVVKRWLQGMETIKDSAAGRLGFERPVLEHPFIL